MAVPAREMEDDSYLVRAVQAGDLEAYSELFRRHYPAVQRACAKRLACPLDAEEIAQAAFVRALERIRQCTGDRQFGGWVQIIARHLCVDSLRARSRVVPTESPVLEDHVDGNEPHDPIIDRERRDHVLRALDTLPPRQRQAVTARALGTGPGQIADDLGLSVGAVDSLILRGRRRLAMAYQRVAGEGGATATATSATAAASLLAAFSLGSTRLLGGVAAAAEAGRDLVAPMVGSVTGAIMVVAVAITGSGPATGPDPATTPSARNPAVVVSVPIPGPAVSGPVVDTAAPGKSPAEVTPGALGVKPATPLPGIAGTGAPTSGPVAGSPAAVDTAPSVATAPAEPAPLPLAVTAEPVVEPVAEVLDTTVPVVTETVADTTQVVDTVGDTVDGAVDVVGGLLGW